MDSKVRKVCLGDYIDNRVKDALEVLKHSQERDQINRLLQPDFCFQESRRHHPGESFTRRRRI